MVAWQDSSGGQHPDGGSGWDIRAQVYGEAGLAVGSDFLVTSYTSSTQDTPAVTGLKDGGFVVTWEDSSGHGDGSSWDIRGKVYGNDGTVTTSDFLVNEKVSSNQYQPVMAALDDGGFHTFTYICFVFEQICLFFVDFSHQRRRPR